MQKFFVETNQIKNDTVQIIGDDVKHIAKVLRLQEGDVIIVCDKNQKISYQAHITNIEKEKVICNIETTVEQQTESKVQVTIFQGLPKADKMEYIIQKAVELGAEKIVPVSMARSIVKIKGQDGEKKILRWQKIAEGAAKQSKRDQIPMVDTIKTIEEVERQIPEFDLFLVAYEEEKGHTLKEVLQSVKQKQEIRIGVVIGPEGGIDSREVETLRQQKAKTVTLGNRILRTETASLCILSNIMYELE